MSEWISVKERLPDKHSRFLAAYRTWVSGSLVYAVAYCRLLDGFFNEVSFFGNNYTPTDNIPSRWIAGNATHWMPLPDPPEPQP
jgi:hypothetical protein